MFESSGTCAGLGMVTLQVTGTQHYTEGALGDATLRVGRWLSTDPIGISGGLNQYTAFGNNPVVFVDPWGLCRRPWYRRAWNYIKEFLKAAGDALQPSPIGPITAAETVTTFTEAYVPLLEHNQAQYENWKEIPGPNPYEDLPRRHFNR